MYYSKTTTVLDHLTFMKDKFDSLAEDEQQLVKEVVACFHYRNGKIQSDGSRGEIDITPKKLLDALSYMFSLDNPDNWKLVNLKIQS